MIVGFPGETEEEFGQTEAFLERVGFYEMHVFKYSRRQGTIAAGMPGQISDVVKARRSEALLELDRRQSRMYRERLMGQEKAVLFEEPAVFDGRQYMLGHTMEYVKAALPSEENLSNRILNRKITGFLQENIVLLQ